MMIYQLMGMGRGRLEFLDPFWGHGDQGRGDQALGEFGITNPAERQKDPDDSRLRNSHFG